MKKTVTEGEFVDEFDVYNRPNNFSIEGRRALYQYLIEIEAGTGDEMDLDVIAICCTYSEYDSVLEAVENYSYSGEKDPQHALEWLQERTEVVEVDDVPNGKIIIADF
jgi:hypothetical protein